MVVGEAAEVDDEISLLALDDRDESDAVVLGYTAEEVEDDRSVLALLVLLDEAVDPDSVVVG